MMFAKYQGRVGDVVTGIVQQSDSRYTLVDLGRVEALLPGSEQVPGERYEHGARIKAVIIEVRSGTKGPQIVLSRRSEELIRELFELEVPEIESGHVVIRAVAREAGYRAKIAVESRAQGVDPVGACVGPRGRRVRMVVAELRGEKIDIIPWNDEPARFVAKALAPARVREVLVDDENEQATVIVPDDQLALAIGREGQNARLATRLTGWRIDIKSESEFAEEEAEIAFSGGEGDDAVGGRCAAILASGRRCPNSALPGSRYCGIPAHRRPWPRTPEPDPERTCVGCGRRRPRTSSCGFRGADGVARRRARRRPRRVGLPERELCRRRVARRGAPDAAAARARDRSRRSVVAVRGLRAARHPDRVRFDAQEARSRYRPRARARARRGRAAPGRGRRQAVRRRRRRGRGGARARR